MFSFNILQPLNTPKWRKFYLRASGNHPKGMTSFHMGAICFSQPLTKTPLYAAIFRGRNRQGYCVAVKGS